MANDLNLCQFIGRLGKDPESRYLPDGSAVCSFSLAVNWKSKEKEGAEWVKCSAFGKLAEICGEYLKKGGQAYVAGRMQTRKWQDKEGNDRYSTEIMVDRMQLLGGKPEGSTERKQEAKPAAKSSAGSFDDMDDDTPFVTCSISRDVIFKNLRWGCE